jgi:CheY-like chemotaxis protein
MIFKEFRQVSEGMGRSYEGSGLGLTLTNKMVQILNGAISVDSPPGIGSTFTIILPLIETNGNFTNFILEDKSQEIETSKIIIDDKIGKLPEVLLAEDNELNIQLIKISLKKLCNIDSTTNAKDAVKMAKTKIYDAILMDINLGEGMDGLQAVKEIRRIPGYNKIPIVAVTGYALKGDKELMLDGGCSDYIPKPFDRETIENMMKKVLFKN